MVTPPPSTAGNRRARPLIPSVPPAGVKEAGPGARNDTSRAQSVFPLRTPEAGRTTVPAGLREVRNSGGWVSCPGSPSGKPGVLPAVPRGHRSGMSHAPSSRPHLPRSCHCSCRPWKSCHPGLSASEIHGSRCAGLAPASGASWASHRPLPQGRSISQRLVARDWSAHSRREPDAWAWSSPGPSSPSWAWSSCTSVSGETTTSTLVTPVARAVSPEARSAPSPAGPGHTRPSNPGQRVSFLLRNAKLLPFMITASITRLLLSVLILVVGPQNNFDMN